jgi:DNA-binding LytR/AlgR family response regulator
VKERDLLYSLAGSKDGGKDFIFVKTNSKLVKLKTDDIYYIEALKDYVVIHTIDTRYTIHSTMKDIEAKMGKEDFLRVHRSFIVRLDKISTIDYPNLMIEKMDKIIPIGGSYREDLNNRIKQV